MFSETFVCPQWGSLSRGSLSGGSLSRGSLSRGISVWGGLCPGGLCPGRSQSGECLSRGISVQGGLCHGDPPNITVVERTVRILLESILICNVSVNTFRNVLHTFI